ncbi:UNVERIFIED_CONTAM: hypothetical protein Slati_3512600 [Sesamum latifolium]|uniref:Uncharacterized protein n=1 Tax=Sesamum latifolium TaxID=2727402 RepID=A0AAW2UKA9_9LAMI
MGDLFQWQLLGRVFCDAVPFPFLGLEDKALVMAKLELGVGSGNRSSDSLGRVPKLSGS